MKAVLISIQPKWCEKILCGRKIIEVRKTRPNMKPPFRCYIYRTKGGTARAGVVGEFVCDNITDALDIDGEEFCAASCLTVDDWLKYADGHKGPVYCWHISEVVIYGKPMALSEFYCPGACREGAVVPLTRPPQSWCYVEEV